MSLLSCPKKLNRSSSDVDISAGMMDFGMVFQGTGPLSSKFIIATFPSLFATYQAVDMECVAGYSLFILISISCTI